jgi:hypothetical protein
VERALEERRHRHGPHQFRRDLVASHHTQLGAESVTNADGLASPEVVGASYFGGLVLKQSSSRVPLGAYVMNWQDDHHAFLDLFRNVGGAFRDFYTNKPNFILDFEYQKDVNLGLVVKQVREIPNPFTTNRTVAFLIDEPTLWCVAQEEAANVFANHRLKEASDTHGDRRVQRFEKVTLPRARSRSCQRSVQRSPLRKMR